jgi:uncharacterized protein
LKDLVAAVRRETRKAMKDGRGSHGYDHVRRVLALSLHLGRLGGADLEVLTLAALLHDIGRPEEDSSNGVTCHAEAGSRIAGKILARHGAPPVLVRRVQECVRRHRFRGHPAPESLEAKILFDADKLDSLGAVGIGRAFLFAGEVGARLHNSAAEALRSSSYSSGDTAYREYLVKLRHLQGKMMTEEGRRLARERAAFMEEFFRRLNLEMRGRA